MKKRAILILVMVLTVLCMISSTAAYADKPLCSGTLDCDNYTFEQVQKFYYNQLTSDEKALYNAITKATVEKPEFTIKIDKGYTKGEMDFLVPRSMGAVMSDMPEKRMLWERPLWHYDYNSKTGALTINLEKNPAYSSYNYKKAMSNFHDMALAVGKEGDTLTKLTKLAKIFAENTDYAHRLNTASESVKSAGYNDSAMGVFLTNLAVCAGMADAFKMLCDELEIPCIVVGNAAHAWNMILIDGKWYECDPTAFVEAEEFSVINILQGTNRFNQGVGGSYEMLIAVAGDFEFPIVSQNDYDCTDLVIVESSSLEYSFREPAAKYLYKVNNGGKTCTITGYEGPQIGDLKIPASIDGYKVTAIGDAAFARTKFDGRLIIPETVTEISLEAFDYCRNLTGELKLPDKLNEIGEAAFLECRNLSGTLRLPNTIKEIGIEAFSGCTKLSGTLRLPDKVERIGNAAFYNCSGLTGDIRLPSKLTTLDATFAECTGLTGTVYVPAALEEWNQNILSGSGVSSISVDTDNPNFTSVDGVLYNKDKTILITCPPGKEGELNLPNTVKEINDSACKGCTKLTGTLNLPISLIKIGKQAFQGIGFTGDLIIPNSVKHIGYGAFADGQYTGELVLSNRLEHLGDWAFTNCAFTGDLVIPDSIQEYEDNCMSIFHGCQFDKIIYSCGNTKFKNIKDGLSGIWCDILEVHNEESVITVHPTCQEEGVKTYTCKNCGNQRTESIERHSYDVGVITKTQTCTEEGIRTYTCTACGHQKKETVAIHTYDTGVVSKEPNCLEEGLKTYTCSGCGFKRTEKFFNWSAHTKIKIPAVAATCKKSGKTEGEQCTICKAVFVAQKKIPAKGHKVGALKVEVKATATKAGKKVSRCKNCNAAMKTVKIKALRTSVLGKTYNSKRIKKSDIRVKTADGKLIPAKYYTITNFKSQKNIGKYTYTIKFKNTCPEYKGTAKVKFEIKPPKPSLKKLTAGKRSITAYWNQRPANQVSGYEVMVSRNKNFNGATHSYDGNNKNAGFYVCDSLKSKKTYYVKVRCYKYVNGVKIYSDWSKAKTMKTK